MKNSSDTLGNRIRDLPACSAVPQPTAPPRAPTDAYMPQYFVVFSFFCFLFRYFLINALRNNVNSCWKWKAYFVTVRQQIEYKIEIELSRAHCGVKESFFGG